MRRMSGTRAPTTCAASISGIVGSGSSVFSRPAKAPCFCSSSKLLSLPNVVRGDGGRGGCAGQAVLQRAEAGGGRSKALSNRRLGRTECFGARVVPRHSRQLGATLAGLPAWQRAAHRAHIARYRCATSAADRRCASTLPAAMDDPDTATVASGERRSQQVASLLWHAPQSWAHTAAGGPHSLVGQTFPSRPARAGRRAASSWRRYTASPRTEGRRSTWWEQEAPSWPPRSPPSSSLPRGG